MQNYSQCLYNKGTDLVWIEQTNRNEGLGADFLLSCACKDILNWSLLCKM